MQRLHLIGAAVPFAVAWINLYKQSTEIPLHHSSEIYSRNITLVYADNSPGFVVLCDSDLKPDENLEFYTEELNRRGWELEEVQDATRYDYALRATFKDGARQLDVWIKAGGTTRVNYIPGWAWGRRWNTAEDG